MNDTPTERPGAMDQIPEPEERAPLPPEDWPGQIYYEPPTGSYWIKDNEGRWIKVNEKAVCVMLRQRGYNHRGVDGQLSQIEQILHRVRVEFNVAFVSPLAGFKAGEVKMNGERILVTSSPELVIPAEGEFPVIKEFLYNLLGDQCARFDCWVKMAVQTLVEGELNNGHILVVAGPKNCGKSFLQNCIITPALGGRASKPYAYLSGQTNFNSELFGAEHWKLEDETPAQDIASRRKFGSFIKQIAANEDLMLHAKGRAGRTIKAFRRVSISLNDEPENLAILPPLDDSLSDKIIILKAQKKPFPMPTGTREEQAKFRDTVNQQLPAYIHWLMHSFEVPEELRDDRFGFKAFQAPEIVEDIEGTSPESQLLELLDHLFAWSNEAKKLDMEKEHGWEAWTALEIMTALTNDHVPIRDIAKKLLPTARVCGNYLGRLVKKKNGNQRVVMHRGHGGVNKYTIRFGGRYRDSGVTDK